MAWSILCSARQGKGQMHEVFKECIIMCLNPQFLHCLVSEGLILQSYSCSPNSFYFFFFPVYACFPKITFGLLKIRVVSWMLVKPGLVGVKGMEHVNLRNSTAVYNVFIVSGHRKIAIKNQGLWCCFYCLALGMTTSSTNPDHSATVYDSLSRSTSDCIQSQAPPWHLSHLPVFGPAVSCNLATRR